MCLARVLRLCILRRDGLGGGCACICRDLNEVRPIGDVEQGSGLLLGGFGSPVIARRGRDIGVAGQLRHRRNVRPGIQQVADKGAPQVMGGEMVHPGLLGPLAEQIVDALSGEVARPQRPSV